MNIVHRTFTLVIALAVASSACSSRERSGSSDGRSTPARSIDCRQKADADDPSECQGHGPKTRKLDCSSEAQTSAAIAAGCERESPGKSDVCCTTDVSGQAEPGDTPDVATNLACTEPSDTLTDSSCAGTTRPRKLDCKSAVEQNAGVTAGCAPEHDDVATDFDLCCPESVRGFHQ